MNAPIQLGVVVETPRHAGLDAALTYASQRLLAPGTLVRVPLGRRPSAFARRANVFPVSERRLATGMNGAQR